ncbi:putative caffeoyl-CoA O-methyltransferase 2 [Pseudolycoriella hygida]|uniref:Caffeoyl-CoA O-methyltransferase 2 n=1 Tax=Pseudolycoriella hygida TaxID=35572 RepID=A0A9Q0NAU5_9DIPT|nr:putative caffeoyl-CoA O-methyltransferase 2 [Pseudolycoriella hygida]
MANLKSFFNTSPRIQYALDHSTKLSEHVEELIKLSLEHPLNIMIGARGVLQTCTAIMEMIQAKNVLDIGLFTGVSALTWALTIPADGKVVSMDINKENYEAYGKRVIENSGVAHKIDIRIQPAVKTLQELIDSGLSGTFDFVFIDANKTDYLNYYNLSFQLLRNGGVIAVDNAMFGDIVLKEEKDESGLTIDGLNNMVSKDVNVQSVLLPIEDGLHIIVKKY